MKKVGRNLIIAFAALVIGHSASCSGRDRDKPSSASIASLNLERGPVISCGPPDQQFGSVNFEISPTKAKEDFILGVELLHSFEYDEAEKAFAGAIEKDPGCAMAYWGVAMCNFHPLWSPPDGSELQKGSKAVALAKSISRKTKKEAGFIEAIAVFYKDWNTAGHLDRCKRYEQAMANLHADYPDDKEAAIFYALALDAAASPADRNFSNQRKAGSILSALYPSTPNHPGIIHYLIHTYDYPGLAQQALPAAREYARVAPSSAHALHMPSHIFTRLGYWDECIASNRQSLASAKCYAEQAHMNAHWSEELHAMDYLVYAFLQKGQNRLAQEQLDSLSVIKKVFPSDFKVAYAYASIPARVELENKDWKRAADARLFPANLNWTKFPWQKAIFHFRRLLGAVRSGNVAEADTELDSLKNKWAVLTGQKDAYKAKQVQIQMLTGAAWIDFVRGQKEKAIHEMSVAAAMEDSTDKHPVTPGEVLPAKELFGDMLSEAHLYDSALKTYEASMQRSPNRFNSLSGAAEAAEKSGNDSKALQYYELLLNLADPAQCKRPELITARAFVKGR